MNHKEHKHFDAEGHVTGASIFLDDIPVPEGTLYAVVYYAPVAHATIRRFEVHQALSLSGVIAILTATDIPGENQIGGIIPDEPLLAEDDIHYWGQPLALVVATAPHIAREAAKLIQVSFDELPVITNSRVAAEKGDFIIPPRTIECGNIETIWEQCDFIISDTVENGAQEHLYLETQGALAIPLEGRSLRIISSTQAPTAVQRTVSKVLNLPMHYIEVDVVRLGGGFGGKEDQATPWAVLAGLAAQALHKPVKLILPRQEDMRLTGKRHPYSSDFTIGITREGKILAFEAKIYQNAGAAADLSPAVLDRTLFHATNAYYIPNVHITGYSCRTNLPPNTAFRGFGGPQGMFIIEAAIHRAAEKLGVPAFKIQQANLLHEGAEFPYGQKVERCVARDTWKQAQEQFELETLSQQIEAWNTQNHWIKKGFAVMPICFGISFTNTMMNQASALVHIYSDGSVGVSTGAVEMGQGVNTKIAQTVMTVFKLPAHRVIIHSTNTTRAANTSPTAASAGADLNGKAAEQACEALFQRLSNLARTTLNANLNDTLAIYDETVWLNGKSMLSWEALIQQAMVQRIKLTEQAHYSTPRIHFDKTTMKGSPFAYHVYGTAIIQATVDCLRGTYTINSVQAIHDYGKSFNHLIDLGQAEGAIAQGIGWMTMEEVIYGENGKLLTDALSTYKVPDIGFTPPMDVRFFEGPENPAGLMNSKAVGEPPFMYGIGAFFAILNGIKSFRADSHYPLKAPLTPEYVFMALHNPIGAVTKHQ